MQIRGPVEPEMVEHRILRRIAILGIGFGVIGVLQLGWMARRNPLGIFLSPGAPSWILVEAASQLLLSFSAVILLAGAIGLFRWKPWGRKWLLIWGLIFGLAIIVNRAARTSRFVGTPEFDGFRATSELNQLLAVAAFPICVVLLLCRREFREVFAADAGYGFEVLQPDHAPCESPRAPSRVEPISEHDISGTVARMVGCMALAMAVVSIVFQVFIHLRSGLQATLVMQMWLGPIGVLFDIMFRVAPFVLLVGSIGLLWTSNWGRRWMLVWAWCFLVYGVMNWALIVLQLRARSATQPGANSTSSFALDVTFAVASWYSFGIVVLIILWGLKLRGASQAN